MPDDPARSSGYRSFADDEKLTFTWVDGRAHSERLAVGVWHAVQDDADETLCGIDLHRVSEFERGRFENASLDEGENPPPRALATWRCPECHARAGLA